MLLFAFSYRAFSKQHPMTCLGLGVLAYAVIFRGILQQGTKFIHKPFTVEALARKVRAVLDG